MPIAQVKYIIMIFTMTFIDSRIEIGGGLWIFII